MRYIYLFFTSFFLIFLSELGDKTQLLVLSFSSKMKTYNILLGVALGSLFSHGIAITFGSALGSLNNEFIHTILEFITYISFVFFGIITLMNKEDPSSNSKKSGILKKVSNLSIGYVFIIAISIAIGEFGDKTFLASLGLGIQYPSFKLFLILGAVLGMVVSDFIAVLFGKFLNSRISEKTMNLLSGSLFLAFGILGLISFFVGLVAGF